MLEKKLKDFWIKKSQINKILNGKVLSLIEERYALNKVPFYTNAYFMAQSS